MNSKFYKRMLDAAHGDEMLVKDAMMRSKIIHGKVDVENVVRFIITKMMVKK